MVDAPIPIKSPRSQSGDHVNPSPKYARFWEQQDSCAFSFAIILPSHAPSSRLTHKEVDFEFGPDEIKAQERLKHAIITSSAIRPIDHDSDMTVYLSVDTSYIAIGYVIMQDDSDKPKAHRPSRFSSMFLNPCEAKYSQPKLELYGLFRSLCAACLWIIGVHNLIVKVDAKYIKGMLNNPDIQPNVTINRWIAGILLFDFMLKHVPGASHSPDGLS